jgi:type VI secretion system secreted protein VgrG
VDIQAQGGPLAVSAAKSLRLNSNQHISVAGHDSIELAAGGHGIRISAKGVEVFGDIKLHGTLSNEGRRGWSTKTTALRKPIYCQTKAFHFNDGVTDEYQPTHPEAGPA